MVWGPLTQVIEARSPQLLNAPTDRPAEEDPPIPASPEMLKAGKLCIWV